MQIGTLLTKQCGYTDLEARDLCKEMKVDIKAEVKSLDATKLKDICDAMHDAGRRWADFAKGADLKYEPLGTLEAPERARVEAFRQRATDMGITNFDVGKMKALAKSENVDIQAAAEAFDAPGSPRTVGRRLAVDLGYNKQYMDDVTDAVEKEIGTKSSKVDLKKLEAKLFPEPNDSVTSRRGGERGSNYYTMRFFDRHGHNHSGTTSAKSTHEHGDEQAVTGALKEGAEQLAKFLTAATGKKYDVGDVRHYVDSGKTPMEAYKKEMSDLED